MGNSPHQSPCRWLEIANIPGHAQVVIATRNKDDSVNSAHRRFGKPRPHQQIEEQQYNKAIAMLPLYRETFDTFDIRCEELGVQRKEIEKFLGAWAGGLSLLPELEDLVMLFRSLSNAFS